MTDTEDNNENKYRVYGYAELNLKTTVSGTTYDDAYDDARDGLRKELVDLIGDDADRFRIDIAEVHDVDHI